MPATSAPRCSHRTSPTSVCWSGVVVAAALLLGGCAAQRLHDQGLRSVAEGRTDQALDELRRASEMEPGNARYRVDYLAERQRAVMRAVTEAEEAGQREQHEATRQKWQRVLALEPHNDRALRGLARIEERRRIDARLQEAQRQIAAGQTDLAQESLRQVLREQPQHAQALALQRSLTEKAAAEQLAREEQLGARAALRRPVTLQFRDATLRQVFEALSRSTLVNIVLDRDVRSDLRTTLFVTDASVGDTIDLILLQNQLEKRVLNSNTLLIYPATAAKQREYGELKVRSFQLSNVEAAHMANLIKAMLKTRDIVTEPRSNTLVMRDTAEAIAVAERLIAANDLPDPEVMLEVEVLEISSSRLSEIGIKWPTSATLSLPSTGSGTATGDNSTSPLTYGDLRRMSRNDLLVTPLSVGLNLKLVDSDANLLASPRIRTRNKEKARILVGDKVPVITNLLSPQSSGQSTVLTGSIQYLDVGIKLEVEPQVYADSDVGIKLALEVSSVSDIVKTESGQAYQIGTRSAQTVLRLRDGETQVLAGLISDQDRNTAQKVPGLGQLPLLGRLFSNDGGDKKKTEIVLSITPRIIRPLVSPDAQLAELWSGSEAAVRARPLRVEAIGSAQMGDASHAPPAAAANVAFPPPAAGTAAPPPAALPRPPATALPSGTNPPVLRPGQLAPVPAATLSVPGAMPRPQPGRSELPTPAQTPTPEAPPAGAEAPAGTVTPR